MSEVNPGPTVVTGDNVMGKGSPMMIGAAATSYVSFYGVTPAQQVASAVQATITATWVTISDGAQGFGFQTSDQIISVIAQLKMIAHVLKTLGIWKGTA